MVDAHLVVGHDFATRIGRHWNVARSNLSILFLNINDQLKDDLGNLLPGVARDGLHLEEKGYDLWTSALKPIFTELLGPPAEMN